MSVAASAARDAVRVIAAHDGPALDSARALVRQYILEIGGDEARADEVVAYLPGGFAPPDGELWIATRGDTPVGCVAVRDIGGGASELKRMYVRADARGLGAARALTTTAIAWAAAHGYACMRLGTLVTMHAAQRLYESLGFVRIPPYRQEEFGRTIYYELALAREGAHT
jgi:ribosomal protein S18 acetylase RimI-like enzyme